MKYTLLEIVQEILSDMDSDEVNSISDTAESEQIAVIVKSTFNAMMVNRDWPHTRKLVSFLASGTTALPTHLKLKSGVKRMITVTYNKVKQGETRKQYLPVKYLEPDAFLRRQNTLNSDQSNVDIITDPTGVELLIRNDISPEYYTSFDDSFMVFDSYDSEVDSTLQESKVQAMAYVLPTWVHTDTSVPDLPDDAFPLLVEESKAKSQFKLRQFVDSKAEIEAGRQNRWLSRKARKIEGGIKYPDYGRNGRKGGRDVTFKRSR
jgi:hypothetical protein